jgi:S1-C subfamily serine protease
MGNRKWWVIAFVAGILLAVSLACAAPIVLTGEGAQVVTATPAGIGGAETGSPTAPVTVQPEIITSAQAEDELLVALYERVSPAVVNITVSRRTSQGQLIDYANGSGFVIDAEGHIVTNNHVVEGADEVIVTFANGMWATAEVVATDPQSDLAVLKVEAPKGVELKPLPLAEPNSLRVGHTVIAIGNPFGLEGTMTTGIVSAVGRSFPVGEATGGRYTLPDVIQTDAAINPGNSGGPLLNLAGEVVGVNAAIESTTGVNAGVGFAIPINTVKRIVPQLIESGRAAYPYLGISAQTLPTLADLALEYDVPVTRGVLVSTVTEGSPAAQAGLRGGNRTVNFRGAEVQLGGDIITAIDGTPLRSFDELLSYLVSYCSPDQTVTLTVVRGSQTLEIPVTLGTRPGGN